jgi:hypothetical protein
MLTDRDAHSFLQATVSGERTTGVDFGGLLPGQEPRPCRNQVEIKCPPLKEPRPVDEVVALLPKTAVPAGRPHAVPAYLPSRAPNISADRPKCCALETGARQPSPIGTPLGGCHDGPRLAALRSMVKLARTLVARIRVRRDHVNPLTPSPMAACNVAPIGVRCRRQLRGRSVTLRSRRSGARSSLVGLKLMNARGANAGDCVTHQPGPTPVDYCSGCPSGGIIVARHQNALVLFLRRCRPAFSLLRHCVGASDA